jgi:hypothetical protein
MVDALHARGRLPQIAFVWDFLRKSGSRRRATGAHAADNGSVGVAVYQLPGTNALDLQSQIKSKIEEASKRFPKGNFFYTGGTLPPPAFVCIFGLTGANLGNALSQLSGEAATGGQQASLLAIDEFSLVLPAVPQPSSLQPWPQV